jgi:formamidopyrimidine-DNA glycosylase
MPELAEVEIFKNYFDITSLDQKITKIIVTDIRILNTDEKPFKNEIIGKKFINSIRHGKYLFAKLNPHFLVFHFGMTGDLSYFQNEEELPPYSKVVFFFENDYALSYISQRMFGRLEITDSIEAFLKKKKLGPDALKMTFEEFQETLKKRSTIAKNALMNQSIIAGIGNIYSDEILFQSHIHPKARINEITDQNVKILFDKIKTVLTYGIKMEGVLEAYSSKYLIPHRKKDGSCPTCGSIIERYEFQGRHGFFCPKCQKLIED